MDIPTVFFEAPYNTPLTGRDFSKIADEFPRGSDNWLLASVMAMLGAEDTTFAGGRIPFLVLGGEFWESFSTYDTFEYKGEVLILSDLIEQVRADAYFLLQKRNCRYPPLVIHSLAILNEPKAKMQSWMREAMKKYPGQADLAAHYASLLTDDNRAVDYLNMAINNLKGDSDARSSLIRIKAERLCYASDLPAVRELLRDHAKAIADADKNTLFYESLLPVTAGMHQGTADSCLETFKRYGGRSGGAGHLLMEFRRRDTANALALANSVIAGETDKPFDPLVEEVFTEGYAKALTDGAIGLISADDGGVVLIAALATAFSETKCPRAFRHYAKDIFELSENKYSAHWYARSCWHYRSAGLRRALQYLVDHKAMIRGEHIVDRSPERLVDVAQMLGAWYRESRRDERVRSCIEDLITCALRQVRQKFHDIPASLVSLVVDVARSASLMEEMLGKIHFGPSPQLARKAHQAYPESAVIKAYLLVSLHDNELDDELRNFYRLNPDLFDSFEGTGLEDSELILHLQSFVKTPDESGPISHHSSEWEGDPARCHPIDVQRMKTDSLIKIAAYIEAFVDPIAGASPPDSWLKPWIGSYEESERELITLLDQKLATATKPPGALSVRNLQVLPVVPGIERPGDALAALMKEIEARRSSESDEFEIAVSELLSRQARSSFSSLLLEYRIEPGRQLQWSDEWTDLVRYRPLQDFVHFMSGAIRKAITQAYPDGTAHSASALRMALNYCRSSVVNDWQAPETGMHRELASSATVDFIYNHGLWMQQSK